MFRRLALVVFCWQWSCCCNLTCNAINVSLLQETIHAGRVFQQFDFLSEAQVQALLQDIKECSFEPSGLSNLANKQQQFGQEDRLLCPTPWWQASLETTDPLIQETSHQLQDLRLLLADVLNRPTLQDLTLEHECYYSISRKGSFLPRHLDERHEELKGAKGWLKPSRRSLSWLVYLSDSNWSLQEHGGALRSFPQQTTLPTSRSTHEGNLQVGWLVNDSAQPVYMDSWLPTIDGTGDYHCILYSLQDNQGVPITHPWLSHAVQDMSIPDFIKANNGLFLRPQDAQDFALIEDRTAWERGHDPAGSEIQDIVPTRGSLVIFDSVLLPHQVQVIHKGNRIALAGWFHEQTQSFPEGLA